MGDKAKDNEKQLKTWRKTRWRNTTTNTKASDPCDHCDLISECPPLQYVSEVPCSDYQLIVSLPVYKINCHPMVAWHVLAAGKVLQAFTSYIKLQVVNYFGFDWNSEICNFKNKQTDAKKWVTHQVLRSACVGGIAGLKGHFKFEWQQETPAKADWDRESGKTQCRETSPPTTIVPKKWGKKTTGSYLYGPFIVDLPTEHGDFQ